MQRFSQLYADLDRTTRTNAKVRAMVDYFQDVPPEDAAWAVFFLTGQRLKRLISGRVLRDWALNATGLPEWLLTDAHAAVGDSAETVSLLVDQGLAEPSGAAAERRLSAWMEDAILPLRDHPVDVQEQLVTEWWGHLPRAEIFLLNKLLTGGFRVGVSKLLVVRALAEVAGLPRPAISHRLMGQWQPTADWYEKLLDPDTEDEDRSRPYPFFLASPLEQPAEALGSVKDWIAEWKWDGIRGQLIRRVGETYLWTRGEELVTDRYPELTLMAERLPDGLVIDGEILAWDEGGVMPFSVLQKRIGRDKLGAKILKEAPVGFLAYDLLEEDSQDLRALPMAERRARLETVVESVGKPLMVSALIETGSWQDLAEIRKESRANRVEGLMLKRQKSSAYGTGRQARRLVEVEDRSAQHRCRDDLRTGRFRPPRQSVHRLHLRRLERRGSGADRQGLFRSFGRRNPETRPLDSEKHHRALRPGALGQGAPCVRARFRGNRRVDPS